MTLDRALLSAIGHRGLPFWSPVTVGVLDRLIDALGIEPAAHVLDIGCGDGAMLAHVTGRLAGRGTGVDRLPGALELAARRAGPLRWRECLPPPGDHPPDLLLVVGSLRAEEAAALPGRALVLGELVTLGSSAIEGLPVAGLRVPERHGAARR